MPDRHDYERLFRDAPVGIFRSSLDGRIAHANPALVRLLGYDTEAEVRALDLATDIYADGGQREALIQRVAGKAYSDVEATWVRQDGRRIVVRLSGRPVHDEEGVLVGFENFVENVTERFEQRRALDRVLSSSGAILFRLSGRNDGTFRAEWVSSSVTEILGFEVHEALEPEWWSEGIHPDDRDAAFADSARILDEGRVVHEYRFRRKEGGYRWFRDEGHALPGVDREGVEVVGVWTDITAEKERRTQLQRSEERFRALAEIAPDGIVALDREGHIVYVNPSAQAMFGSPPDELVGQPFTVLFPERFRGFNRRAFEGMLHGSEPREMRPRTLLGRRRDGTEFPGEVAFAVDPEREGLAITAVIRDVTARLELEAERSLLHGGHGTLVDASGRPRGIIPVCSNCKSIKDEAGQWQPMEVYVRDRAPVEFSHGFCDDCVTKLYGSLD